MSGVIVHRLYIHIHGEVSPLDDGALLVLFGGISSSVARTSRRAGVFVRIQRHQRLVGSGGGDRSAWHAHGLCGTTSLRET